MESFELGLRCQDIHAGLRSVDPNSAALTRLDDTRMVGMEAGHCVQRASSPSMHSVTSLDCVPAGHPRWVLLNVSLGSATLSFSTSALPNCLASSIG
jgi:hypothetical protein